MGARTAETYQAIASMLFTRLSVRVRERWLATLFGFGLVTQLLGIGRTFLFRSRPLLNADAAVFQHGGWYILQGAIPYVDFWDPKPPLTFETTAVLAMIAGENMYWLHVLSVLATAGAAIGITLVVGLLTYELTQNEMAGLVSGLVMLTLPGFHYLPTFGFRPKYFALLFGLVGILFVLRDRPLLAGGAAAASPAYWQFGLVFPLLVIGMAARRDPRSDTPRALIGATAVSVVVLLPIVLWDAFVPMVVETILASIHTPEEQSLLFRLGKGPLVLGYTTVVVLVGLSGLVRLVADQRDRVLWVVVLGLWAAVQILVFDFDSYPDLFLGMVLVSVGAGYLYATGSRRSRVGLGGTLVVLLLISVVALGGVGFLTYPVSSEYYPFALEEEKSPADQPLLQRTIVGVGYSMDMEQDRGSGSAGSADTSPAKYPDMTPKMRHIYWNKVKPDSCHYRLSVMERQWMRLTGQSGDERTCGTLPDRVFGDRPG